MAHRPTRFYMYEPHELPLFHAEMLDCVRARARTDYLDHQHTTGYWMTQQLRSHAARTRHPEQASVFVVPLWLQLSWQLGACNGTSHLERVADSLRALNATSTFKRFASHHLLPASTFMMREPPHSRALARRQQHDAQDPQLGCYRVWPTFRGFGFFPKEPLLERLVDRLRVAHMERTPPVPSELCRMHLPGSKTRLYDEMPPQWWRLQTLVLPYVVDARVTALARETEATSFDYAHWSRRPHTIFFAGNCVRKRGAAYVRLGLTQLNRAWSDAKVHCGHVGSGEWQGWLAEGAEPYLATSRHNASRRRAATSSIVADERTDHLAAALRGELVLPPLAPADVAAAMAASKFCLSPRGDSPSSGRLFHALALGCIPIIVSDPWRRMAQPFGGLLDYDEAALFLSEREAITAPVATLAARFEALGGRLVRGIAKGAAGASSREHATTAAATTKPRWRFAPTHALAAGLLEARLAAMRRMHKAALWQLPDNELLANLTLESARRLVASRESGLVGE